MTGLELITDKIISQAKEKEQENITKAEEKANDIKKDYAAKIEKIKKDGDNAIEEYIKISDERFNLSCESQKRTLMLETVRNAAEEIISLAKEKISSFSDDEYFGFLTEIYKNQCGDIKNGEIILCKKDKARLPKDFIQSLNPNLTLAKDDTPGLGFVIRCGKVEQNCTIDALFEEKANLLTDIVLKE